MNNVYMSNCLDHFIYHLHERGILNCIPTDDDDNVTSYQIMGYGSGANIALYYSKECLLNDQTSLFSQLILVNPYTHLDNLLKN
jgi:hypothetical protein